MQDSYPWKETYQRMLQESDPRRLHELVLATEQALVERARELVNSSDHREERSELAVAMAALLTIKTHKLGWPAILAG
ncbi:MAG: hypothetical protein WAN14_10755 [Candidatus Acidiferrales bacterium]